MKHECNKTRRVNNFGLSFAKRRSLVLSSLLGAGLAASAHGAVLVDITTNVAPAGGAAHEVYDPATQGDNLIPVSDTDLVQGLTAAVTYLGGQDESVINGTTRESSRGISAWTDGSISTVYAEGGPGGDAVDHEAYGTVATNADTVDDVFVTFDMGAEFSLSKINVIMGWNDNGRAESSFNVLTSIDGTVFSEIASYTKGGIVTPNDLPITHLFSIVDSVGDNIADNVRFVRLRFTDADNSHAGLVEVDVFGSPIPEPTCGILLGFAALGLLKRRR